MWKKDLISRLVKLSVPIALQNLFFVLGNSVTTFMTGRLGELPIAATGLSNQLFFILSLVQFGVSSGGSIFTAQFWGNGDRKSIIHTLGVSLVLGILAGGIFMLIALGFPNVFLKIFTDDADVVSTAAGLLRIAGISFLFTPTINTYAHILRTTGNVKLPMFVSTTGVLLNTLLGYGLIFGKLGMPELGVIGAPTANLAARAAECILLIWLVYRLKTPLAAPLRQIFSFDRNFLKKILRKVLPVASNELFWALGISAYSAIYARLGTNSYAAVTIKDTMENLMFVPFIGVTSACAIMVGNTIGAGKAEKAQIIVRQAFFFNVMLAVVLGIVLGIFRFPIISVFKLTPATQKLAANMLLVLSAALWVRTSNFVFFIGMMRSGGDTRFAYFMDAGAMWLVGVPLALAGAFLFHLPVHFVYLLVMAEESLKFAVSLWRYRSRRWIHHLASARMQDGFS